MTQKRYLPEAKGKKKGQKLIIKKKKEEERIEIKT